MFADPYRLMNFEQVAIIMKADVLFKHQKHRIYTQFKHNKYSMTLA